VKRISKKTTAAQLAAVVTAALTKRGIRAVLTGGAVVSIYTRNAYVSSDLDFITTSPHEEVTAAMQTLGFRRKGKDFVHPKTDFTVEFPSGPLGLGDRTPVEAEGSKRIDGVAVRLLSPTQSVMDRLAWYYHSNDRQCLDQAAAVCRKQRVDLKEVRRWSKEEGALDKFEKIRSKLA